MNKQLENLITASLLFAGSIAIGTIGFISIENVSLIDAIYMSIITISTVGFTEVTELSATGRIFTSIYILLNLGIFAYTVSALSSYFFEGKLKSIFKSYKSGMEISKLKNHVIVCGFGRNGMQACEELEKSGRDFVIIEKDAQVAEEIPEKMIWYLGDATHDDTLKAVGIERAETIIVATPSDASNVFITLTARHTHETINIISRATNVETESKLYRAGANRVILPDVLGGMFMAQLITKPTVIEFLNLLNGSSGQNYHLEEFGYEQLKEKHRNKTLKELEIKKHCGVTVVGVKDNMKGIIPSPDEDTFIGKDDHLIILGSDRTLKSFVEQYTTQG